MIRTNIVKLSSIDAVAYRQKLTAGGSCVVVIRADSDQPGIAAISKTSGDAIPTANTSKKLFTAEIFAEAMTLTYGMPYKKQGSVQYKGEKVKEETPAAAEENTPEEVTVAGEDYIKIVEKYTDKSGKLSYALLNKDMIKFAHSSSVVRKMVSDAAKAEDIRLYVTGTKFRNITGNKYLTDAEVLKISDLLDEVSPKGVYKELNDEIRKNLKDAKKK